MNKRQLSKRRRLELKSKEAKEELKTISLVLGGGLFFVVGLVSLLTFSSDNGISIPYYWYIYALIAFVVTEIIYWFCLGKKLKNKETPMDRAAEDKVFSVFLAVIISFFVMGWIKFGIYISRIFDLKAIFGFLKQVVITIVGGILLIALVVFIGYVYVWINSFKFRKQYNERINKKGVKKK